MYKKSEKAEETSRAHVSCRLTCMEQQSTPRPLL